jgi:hypothetical protein
MMNFGELEITPEDLECLVKLVGALCVSFDLAEFIVQRELVDLQDGSEWVVDVSVLAHH